MSRTFETVLHQKMQNVKDIVRKKCGACKLKKAIREIADPPVKLYLTEINKWRIVMFVMYLNNKENAGSKH